jgi:diguanylate cyclase (GGDEF)-like protein/PAS domain S-box-containing protein
MGARSTAVDAVPRLLGLLDRARAVRGPEDLDDVLAAVVLAVSELLEVQTVALNLVAREDECLRVTHLAGSDEARDALLGGESRAADWEPLLQEAFRRGSTFLVLGEDFDWTGHPVPCHVPELEFNGSDGRWEADDALLAVLHGAEGDMLGILSVDEPRSGLRPGRAERDVLDVVAAHAAIAIEEAQRAAGAAREQRTRDCLLVHSQRLPHLGDPAAVIGVMTTAVAEALVLTCVRGWLAGDDGVLQPVARAGPGCPEAVHAAVVTARVDAALAAAGGGAGAVLLDAGTVDRELLELRACPPETRERRARRWDGHLLVLAPRRADGTLIGVVTGEAPADGRLPSRLAVQGAALFATHAALAAAGIEHLTALGASESRAAAVLRSAMDAIVTLDHEGSILAINPAAEQLLGRTAGEVRGRTVGEMFVPAALRARHDADFAAARGQAAHAIVGQRVTTRLQRSDGVEVPVEMALARADLDGQVIFTAFIRDISDRLAGEEAVRAERDRAQRYLDVAGTLLVVLDDRGRLSLLNRKGCDVLGYEQGDLLGRDWFAQVVPDGDRATARSVFASLMAGETESGAYVEHEVVRRDGRQRLIGWRNTVLREADGRISGTLSSGEDITEQRQTEGRIAHLAFHDPLTGLANRAQLEARLDDAVLRAGSSGTAVALLSIDLDDFKLVNDSFGHATGDGLLVAVAGRLGATIRGTDLLARHGGDEFLLLLDDLPADAVAAAQAAAAKLVAAFDDPFVVAGAELWIGASVGVSVMPEDAAGAQGLLSHADAALYEAKTAGRHGHALYTATHADRRHRLSLGGRLRRALAGGEFELHYQPIVRLASLEVVGAEALLRWRRPDGTLVPPGDFVPFAEESGLIEPIGEWVIREACAQAAAWRLAGRDRSVAFNLSARQLLRADLVGTIAAALADNGLPARSVTAEITETALLRDAGRARGVLHDLSDLGVRIALDDFGAAYSSLSRLRELPVQVLKIDRAFLHGVPGDPAATEIMRAVLQLARGLGMVAVAEGVEHADQLPLLVGEGCALGQGFLLGRPVPAAELDLGAPAAA